MDKKDIKILNYEKQSGGEEIRIYYEWGGVTGCFKPYDFISTAIKELKQNQQVLWYLQHKHNFPEYELINFVEAFFNDGLAIYDQEGKIKFLEEECKEYEDSITRLRKLCNAIYGGLFNKMEKEIIELIGLYDYGGGLWGDSRATLGISSDGQTDEGTKLHSGQLKRILFPLIKRDKCQEGKTVSSRIIKKWIEEIFKTHKRKIRENSIRVILSRMGYSKEGRHYE